MKKIFATLMLLMCVTAVFAGKEGDSAINNPSKQQAACHNEVGKWNPQNKNCDPNACGCLFHQIEHFILEIFE